jgi:hypothetical protein
MLTKMAKNKKISKFSNFTSYYAVANCSYGVFLAVQIRLGDFSLAGFRAYDV